MNLLIAVDAPRGSRWCYPTISLHQNVKWSHLQLQSSLSTDLFRGMENVSSLPPLTINPPGPPQTLRAGPRTAQRFPLIRQSRQSAPIFVIAAETW